MYWDIVKGVAILLIILGHATFTKEVSPTRVFLYSFHVPLFILVSGYFFHHSLRHSNQEIILKGVVQLIIPWLIMGIINWACYYADPSLGWKRNLSDLYTCCVRTLYFLPTLFICRCLTLLVERSRIRRKWIAYLLVFAVFQVTPDWGNQAATKFLFPAFIVGLYINRYQLTSFYKKNRLLWAGLFCTAFALMLLFFKEDMCLYKNLDFYLFNEQFGSPLHILYYNLFRSVIGIIGSVAVLAIIYELYRLSLPSSRNPLAFLGRHTLWIYFICGQAWRIRFFSEQWLFSYQEGSTLAVLDGFLKTLLFSIPLAILLEYIYGFFEKTVYKIFLPQR